LTYTAHCLYNGFRVANPSCECPQCCLKSEIDNGITALASDITSLSTIYSNTIDAGNTAQLLAEISSNTLGAVGLNNLLQSASPYLSDPVLNAYFSLSGVTFTHLASIHNQNKPVSAAVWYGLSTLGLSEPQMAILSDQQDDKMISPRENLEGLVNLTKSNLQALYGEKLSYFLRDTLDGAADSVIVLLRENKGNLAEAQLMLPSAYLRAGHV
jgi:hypothetical protein